MIESAPLVDGGSEFEARYACAKGTSPRLGVRHERGAYNTYVSCMCLPYRVGRPEQINLIDVIQSGVHSDAKPRKR
jgi:hypothetical protein